ncbi:Casparian strip membrane protein [Parasponia andersonii]|uniref:CASP-like protein n=1 Tax=Parasponia andersonii TaxID=3476 RepID=A0A2P5D5L8_PARAD|nr:Casparian strip membrane protein [Parasponia andersonii]
MREKETNNNAGAISSPTPMLQVHDRDQAAGDTNNGGMRTTETLLRLIPIAPCIAALVVMLHNSQTNDFGSVSYSHLGAFRYLVHVNGICAGYSLLSAVIAAMPRPPKMSQAWTFFFLDQVMTYLVLAAGAASTEVLYLAFKGNPAITWSSACSSFPTFCHKATASVAVTFVVVASYALLSLISSYKLFTNYQPPTLNPAISKPSIQVATFHA